MAHYRITASGPDKTSEGSVLDSEVAAVDLNMNDLIQRGGNVHLLFSGGIESAVLAHFLEPWADRVVLFWINTGDKAPDHVAYIRGYGKRFKLVELGSNPRSSWSQHGVPVNIFPVSSRMETVPAGERLQPWPSCCARSRGLPMNTMAQVVLDEFTRRGLATIFIHGQRWEDGAFRSASEAGISGVEYHGPLWDWNRDDVFRYIERHSISLPPHYEYVSDSVECLSCPAETSASKLAYLDKFFPKIGQEVRRHAARANALAMTELREEAATLAGPVLGKAD